MAAIAAIRSPLQFQTESVWDARHGSPV